MIDFYFKGTNMNENIINYDSLFESMLKCEKGVRWKPSVKCFTINGIEEIAKMHNRLEKGTWKDGKPKEIKITYPKKRDGLSISFRDRVYQRSINDNVLYPEMVNHFIFDNCACQKGKGTSFARRRVKEHLWNHYCNYKTNGYVLQIDIKGYYPNMSHDAVKKCFKRYLDSETFEMIQSVLDNQYSGDVGYNPGSQMVQIAGISLLNDIDHHIKEKLHIKHYIRYMDDFLLIHDDKNVLEKCFNEIEIKLKQIGFELNMKKTLIKKLKCGFEFLGFNYKVAKTGKIIMTLKSESVKRERKKLFRLVNLCKIGKITKEKVNECYKSWKAFALEGNSYKLLRRMDRYYSDLWRCES
jgi:hypothetical protein